MSVSLPGGSWSLCRWSESGRHQRGGLWNTRAPAAVERLAGIREAIAELDAHVVRSSQTKPSADPTAELKGRLAEIEMTFRASREVMQGTNSTAAKTAPVQMSQDNVIKAGRGQDG